MGERRKLWISVGVNVNCRWQWQWQPSHLPFCRSLVRLTFHTSLGALLPDCSTTCSLYSNGRALKVQAPTTPLDSLPALLLSPAKSNGSTTREPVSSPTY